MTLSPAPAVPGILESRNQSAPASNAPAGAIAVSPHFFVMKATPPTKAVRELIRASLANG
jgi:hypothetical protein